MCWQNNSAARFCSERDMNQMSFKEQKNVILVSLYCIILYSTILSIWYMKTLFKWSILYVCEPYSPINQFPSPFFTSLYLISGWSSCHIKCYDVFFILLNLLLFFDDEWKHNHNFMWTITFIYFGGARGVMVIVVGNEHGDTSSNPGRDWFPFT